MRLKARLYHALIGLTQATGFAGGLDFRYTGNARWMPLVGGMHMALPEKLLTVGTEQVIGHTMMSCQAGH